MQQDPGFVDDSEDIRELLRLTMELASGFEVHEAVDGASAVGRRWGAQT